MTVEVWDLEPDTPEWLPSIIIRLLSADIPPTAIARAFSMSVDPIRELLIDLRISRYGTAELGEAITFRMWRAIDDINDLIEKAPPARRLALNMALISKASALVGSQTPDMLQKLQNELASVMSETRSTDEKVVGSIYETVAADAPVDDPEERLTGRTP